MAISGEKKIFKRQILLISILGFFIFGAGYIFALQFGVVFSSHDHSMAHGKIKNQENMHKHETLEITDNIEFDFELIQENSNNWNIFLNVKGIKFSPENVGKQHIDGQGHAHVFVDGVKHGRMYSYWYHLGFIDFGSEITVTLNSNNHKAFIKGGELVEVTHQLTK